MPALPLAPPDRFIGANPTGPDGDYHVRPWLDSIETFLHAQPHLDQSSWLPTALSYMDHSARTTWTTHLLPDLVVKHESAHPTVPFVPTWQVFKTAMIGRFGGQASRAASTKLRSHKCRYSTSMHDYSSRFRALVDKANEAEDAQIRIPPPEQATLFMAGLPRELRIFVTGAAPAAGFQNLHDCEQFCTLKQSSYNELYSHENRPAPAATSHKPSFPSRRPRSPSRDKNRPAGNFKRRRQDQSSQRAFGPSRPRQPPASDPKNTDPKPVKCAYCKKLGHYIHECRARPNNKSAHKDDASNSKAKVSEKKGF